MNTLLVRTNQSSYGLPIMKQENRVRCMPMRARRNAQMEVMGVAIIVVLIAIALLFVISFKVNSASSAKNTQVAYGSEQLGTNFLAAALKTTVCPKYTVEDLIAACAKGNGLSCSGNACAEANATIQTITHKTLDPWGTGYRFNIIYPSSAFMLVANNSCAAQSPKYKPGIFFIPLYETGQTITVQLDICR